MNVEGSAPLRDIPNVVRAIQELGRHSMEKFRDQQQSPEGFDIVYVEDDLDQKFVC